MTTDAWTLVLAGGAGRRLADVTGGVPKQFWSSDGGRPLVEQTVERLSWLTPSHRTVTVVDASHGEYVAALPRRDRLGHVVDQPGDRGTAAGVLLGLMHVLDRAPDATVILTPADHGVRGTTQFRRGLAAARDAVQTRLANVVLFGCEADTPASDYGWITAQVPGQPGAAIPLRQVAGFVEKPSPGRARALLAAGAVWNTMVLVARAAALIELYREHAPDLLGFFEQARTLPDRSRRRYLERRYHAIVPRDFSRDLLGRARGLTLYVWPRTMGWTDLGTPDRLRDWQSTGGTEAAGASAPRAAPGRLALAPGPGRARELVGVREPVVDAATVGPVERPGEPRRQVFGRRADEERVARRSLPLDDATERVVLDRPSLLSV